MEKTYLSEAFKALKLLDEDTFDVTSSGIEELQDFLTTDDVEEETIEVVDTEAETEEEVKDSYLGKAILECCVCQLLLYKDKKDIKLDETGELANVDEECPLCGSMGFKIIGQVSPYTETEVEVTTDDETIDDSDIEVKVDDKEVTEECNKNTRTKFHKKIKNEEFEKVEIETDKEKIKIETEPKEDAEVIEPISDEIKSEIEAQSDDETEIEIDEFSEEDFDELGESYLKNIYSNIKSYKTTDASQAKNSLKLEGIITFNSGKQKKTNFIFEAKDATKSGKVRFIGENAQICRGKKAFTLTGTIQNNKFLSESLNYNYQVKDANGKSKRLYGTVKHK